MAEEQEQTQSESTQSGISDILKLMEGGADEEKVPEESEDVEPEKAGSEDTPKEPEVPVAEPPSEKKEEVTPPKEEVKPPEKKKEEQRKPTAEEVEATRQAAIEQIAKNYQIGEEDAEALLTEPNKVLPKFFGRLFVDMYGTLMQTQMASMPQIVTGLLNEREQAQKQSKTFFEKFPALNKPEYYDTIREVTQSVRAANPNLSLEEAMQRIGAITAFSLNIPLEPEESREQPRQETTVPKQGFRPAAPGGATTPAQKKKAPTNEFIEFMEELGKLE